MIESKGYKITPIDGDLAVSRNAEIGRDVDIHGKARVAGSLKVEGFLDAPHIKGAAKGLFNSVEELTREYPNPRPGWFAIVLDATNKEMGILYKAENRGWVATTDEARPYEFIMDSINVFASKGELEDERSRATEAEEQLRKGIEQEATRATEAEEQLRKGIEQEATRATEAEDNIKSKALQTDTVHFSQDTRGVSLGGRSIDGKSVVDELIPVATTEMPGAMSPEDKVQILNNKKDIENTNIGIEEIKAVLVDGSFVVGVANLANAVKAGAVTFEMLDGKLRLSVSVVDDLETANTLMPLSANQGKILKELIDIINGTGEGSTDKKITDAIAALVDSAPENLDTLRELAEWIENHGAEVAGMLTAIEGLYNELGREIDARMSVDNDTRGKGVLFGGFSNRQTTADEVFIGYKNINQNAEGAFTIPAATTEKAGVMSAEDKVLLEANATNLTETKKNIANQLLVTPTANSVEVVGRNEQSMRINFEGDIPAATTENAGVMSAEDKTIIRSLAEVVKEEEKADTLYIVDAQGNVVAHFGNEGLTAVDVLLKGQDGLRISVLEKISTSKSLTEDEYSNLKSLLFSISAMYEDALYITDAQGNVILQITNNGISFVSSSKRTWMEGLVMMSLCDSLGTSGVWQETIAKNTGMSFDKKLNYNGNNDVAFSVGGSQTATHPNGGFDRAIRLVNYVNSGGKCDVLFLENINDMTWVNLDKTKEDIDAMVTTEQPFFCEQYRFIDTSTTDYHSAGVYFRENLSSCLNGLSPKKGTTIYIGYGRSGKKLTVTSGASINGSFSITVGGKDYNISVNSGDTISAIIEKILEIDYANPNYTDTKVDGENAVLFMPTDAEGTASLIFNANGTGVTATITSVDSKSYRAESYNSLDTTSSAWLTVSNWGELWSHNLVQIMKGLIEYLSSNLPSTQLYWFIPTRFSGKVPTAKRIDGSIDFDAYKADDKRYDMCTYIQRKVCEYYSIPVIDLHNEGGINIYNQLSYYSLNGGVHPPHSTYEYWGNKATKFIV